MTDLSSRINKFILKQIHISSKEEAEKYGIKLPPEEAGPKWTSQDKPPEKASIMEKVPKAKKSSKTKKPAEAKIFPNRRFAPTKATPLEEVAHQLSPKGPGYHSPEEVASDIREAKRLAGVISGKKGTIKEE
jgi:hypothetical protein